MIAETGKVGARGQSGRAGALQDWRQGRCVVLAMWYSRCGTQQRRQHSVTAKQKRCDGVCVKGVSVVFALKGIYLYCRS